MLLHFGRLFYVVVDSECEFFRDGVLAGEFFEGFELAASVLVLESDVGDDGAYAVDVVGHDDAAEGFDKCDYNGLQVVDSYDISEPHSQHHIGCPIERPNINLQPRRILNALGLNPVMKWIKTSHQYQYERYDMRICKVDQKHLDQLPILFMVYVPDEIDLYLFDFVGAVWEFEQDEQSAVQHEVEVAGDIDEEDDEAQEIDGKVMGDIVVYDFLYDL